jgi:hypothetical protein
MRDLRRISLEDMVLLPIHIELSVLLPASAERVFSSLAASEPWTEWFSFLRKVEYLTAARGVGTERDVTTKIGVIREHFIAWQPNRISFFARQSSTIGVVAFAEDYQIEALGDDSRLHWHIYAELHPLFQPLTGVVSKMGRFLFSESLLSFSAWLSKHR